MNSVTLSYVPGNGMMPGTFTATVTVAANWTVSGAWLSGGGLNQQMNGPASGMGPCSCAYTLTALAQGATTYTATAYFQQLQQQTASGQCTT
jgi:hypothetical protein